MDVLVGKQRVRRSVPAPRLRLLIELEPSYRVFFGNLADLLLCRRAPQVSVTSRPIPFWDDVFVPSGAPWSSFLESMLWHFLLLILLVWSQSKVWVPEKRFSQRDAFPRTVTYYPLTQSFPAAGGRAPSVPAPMRARQTSKHQRAIRVRQQQEQSIVTPPEIKQVTPRLPNLLGSRVVTPVVPFPANTGPRRSALAEPLGVVPPQPQVAESTARRLALPQASAVAPAPELGGPSAGHVMRTPNTGGLPVVPPPPSVQGSGGAAGGARLGPLSGAGSGVILPPPSVEVDGNYGSSARPGALSGDGARIVPPPPSVQNPGRLVGTGRSSSLSGALSGANSQVVPPPPSVQGSGGPAGGTRGGSISGAGSEIVPPAPSVENAGNSGRSGRPGGLGLGTGVIPPPPLVQGTGNAAGSARLGSTPGGSSQVIPPPPSVQSSGGPAGGTRVGSLSGAGSEVVPPPLSIENAGDSSAGGRVASLPGDGSQIGPPPPSARNAGNSGFTGTATAATAQPVVASSPAVQVSNENKATVENKPTFEEVPLNSLGLVLALPGTSFFSNFEVFVAQRRVAKDHLQLIKLVYEFLPYQRRLSEYDLEHLPARIIKLRVTPDPSCDESLARMMQVQPDPRRPAIDYSKLPAALRSADLNAALACYRTSADDFQKAMSRAH